MLPTFDANRVLLTRNWSFPPTAQTTIISETWSLPGHRDTLPLRYLVIFQI